MHPDEAVHLAIQDLRDPTPRIGPSAPHEHTPSRAYELLHAYFAPMHWYVQDGRTPAGADGGTLVGHLPRPRFVVDAEPEAEAALLPLAGLCP